MRGECVALAWIVPREDVAEVASTSGRGRRTRAGVSSLDPAGRCTVSFHPGYAPFCHTAPVRSFRVSALPRQSLALASAVS